MATVSIIMPSYNSENYIEFALHSIYQQMYKDVELIICDGASTDKTLEIIEKYKCKLNIRCISESDDGVNDACRKGFNLASGEYICHLCSTDGYFDPTFLLESTKFLKKNHQYDAIFSSGAQEINENGKPKYRWRPWIQPVFEILPYEWHKMIAVQHAVPFPDMGWLVKKKVFLKHFPQISDTKYYGKINPFLGFVKALYESNYKFAVLSQMSSYGRHHPEQWGSKVAKQTKITLRDFKKIKNRQIFKFNFGIYTIAIRIYAALLFLLFFFLFGGIGYYYQKVVELLKNK